MIVWLMLLLLFNAGVDRMRWRPWKFLTISHDVLLFCCFVVLLIDGDEERDRLIGGRYARDNGKCGVVLYQVR